MSTSSSPCGRAEALRDYAFDELPPDERRTMKQHLAGCGDCALELDQLLMTTASLRILPDREIPQRIAFVSDRVFERSAFWRFWNAGFASACVLSAALIVSAWHFSSSASRPAEARTAVQTALVASNQGTSNQVASNQINQDRVNAAVAKAVAQVRAEDARMIETAVEESGQKREAEYRNRIVAMQESFDVLRKKLNVSYASLGANETGAGQ